MGTNLILDLGNHSVPGKSGVVPHRGTVECHCRTRGGFDPVGGTGNWTGEDEWKPKTQWGTSPRTDQNW